MPTSVQLHRTSSGNDVPFTARVRSTGDLGLIERGSADRIPKELIRLAANLAQSGSESSRFHWHEAGGSTVWRVSIDRLGEGPHQEMLLDGEPNVEYPHGLSSREFEVLTLLVAGLSNAEVATQLWVSERTAASHVNRILQKLAVPSRTAAATFALDSGLILVPPPGDKENYARLSLSEILRDPDTERERRVRPDSAATTPRRVQRELVVGAVIPRSGKGSDDGVEMLNGLQLAIEELNGAGGIRGRSIRPLIVDVDVSSPSSVRSAFRSLLARGADVLTSGYLAAQEVAHEVAGDSGVPYLHAATSGAMERAVASDLARFGRIFQTGASDTMYAPTFVSYMTGIRDRGVWTPPSRRLVVLTKGWSHVDFGVVDAIALAGEQGWDLEVVRVVGPEHGDAWYRTALTALREPTAAVMVGSYFVDDVAQAVAAVRQCRAATLAYATYAPSVPAFRAGLGSDAEGVLWATMTGTYSDRMGLGFANRYRDRFGVAPGRSHAGIAYDRMQMIALAWSLSQDLADPDELARHLRARPHRGVNGTYNFDTPGQAALSFRGDDGDPSLAQPELIFQIQHGNHVIVDGGPFTTGAFQLPRSTDPPRLIA
ncbi:ABC transporter substrate-binding protein [Microbacterium aurantiacum]|uniref:ABC transporter substrate-binding protein n=1 Tax=Microbacterium aurantiacum TaxID=162393 RepID=UPI00342F988D